MEDIVGYVEYFLCHGILPSKSKLFSGEQKAIYFC